MSGLASGLELRCLDHSDALDVLALQRAAFACEAETYDDPYLPALTQTRAEIEEELRTSLGFVAIVGARIVGAIRMRQFDNTLQINRITVDPTWQGCGIGTALIRAAETATTAARASLFVRVRSVANLRLYRRLGYAGDGPDGFRPDRELACLVKDLRS